MGRVRLRSASKAPQRVKAEPVKGVRKPRKVSAQKNRGAVKVESSLAESKAGIVQASASQGVQPGPFPTLSRPTPEECRYATRVLKKLHGDPEAERQVHGGVETHPECAPSVLDALVRTILSQNTTDTTSHKAFESMKKSFPTWESVRTGNPAAIADSIRVGGLADIKTARIQEILTKVREERGECSLEHLRGEPDEEVKRYLCSFKGVGPKTASCVLMFCLDRPEFAVDVHIWKMAISLGWVPARATREQAYEHLNGRVPEDVKYALHVLLVEHGKVFKNDVKLLRMKKEEAS